MFWLLVGCKCLQRMCLILTKTYFINIFKHRYKKGGTMFLFTSLLDTFCNKLNGCVCVCRKCVSCYIKYTVRVSPVTHFCHVVNDLQLQRMLDFPPPPAPLNYITS